MADLPVEKHQLESLNSQKSSSTDNFQEKVRQWETETGRGRKNIFFHSYNPAAASLSLSLFNLLSRKLFISEVEVRRKFQFS